MDKDRKRNEMISEKLEELVSLVRHERQSLAELTEMAQKTRSDSMSKVTSSFEPSSIDAIIRDRSEKMERAALTNTFLAADDE